MKAHSTRYFTIIPAAGSGSRCSHDQPKQYCRIGDKTLLEWSLQPFLAADWIESIVIALAEDDQHFQQLPIARHPKLLTVTGGALRQDSVMAALAALANVAAQDDYILVHDAARPNLHPFDLSRLITELADEPAGGLLCAPVVDSIKRVQNHQVSEALAREELFRALTPQMFRYGILNRALQAHYPLSDEATAVQLAGYPVKMVLGRSDNLKVTLPEDLLIMQALLTETLNEVEA